MSQNSESGFFAMVERLYRTFVALYWIAIIVLLPIMAIHGLYKACLRKTTARDKHERRYWNNELVFNSCLLYGVVAVYYHILQDILFIPFGLQAQADFTGWFETVLGLPAALWYAYTDRSLALSNDPLTFFIPTFGFVFVLFVCSFGLNCFRVFGYEDVDGSWVPSERRCRVIREEFDREEAPFRALSAQWYDLQVQHPRNHPAWDSLADEQREKLTVKWDTEAAVLKMKMDECPRASYFTRLK
ncbi:hypothetical protein [Paraburkholderia aromaticivorans]|uniref:hypothetical protein n=1 Tax=Paraburkholderia aromaticivorans TaxID=2026199 RepID=UPI0038B7330D